MDHGVKISEIPTGVVPPVRLTPGLSTYVGTAPINLVDETAVNKPILLFNLADAVEKIGYMEGLDWSKWTLMEAAKAHFIAYGVGPIVVINVLDPKNGAHVSHIVTEPLVLDANGDATVDVYGTSTPEFGVLKSTVVVKVAGVTKALGTDYTLAFDDNGFLVISRVTTGTIAALATIVVTCDVLNPAGVVANDIIGGFSGGQYKGIQAIEQVYPRLRLVPGFVLAPKWSETPTVAAALITKAGSINGSFRAEALLDLSTDPAVIGDSSLAGAWKSDNGYDKVDGVPCWPLVKNGDDQYHGSTVVACVANITDNAHSGIPYASPSNKPLVGTSVVLDDGPEVLLTQPEANNLNAEGIVTFLNGFNGWRTWGNRTGGYPGTTDPKDAFIPIRRMFNWIGNTIILTVDRDVDEPGNKRLIQGVVGTIGAFFNGLIAQGALVDGKIEFRADENPVTDLSDGIIRFHNTLAPPSPAESIEFITEYNPALLAALFT